VQDIGGIVPRRIAVGSDDEFATEFVEPLEVAALTVDWVSELLR
jgi:hypothetical protein